MWGTPIGVAAGSTPGWQLAALAGCSPGPSRHPLGRLLLAPRSSVFSLLPSLEAPWGLCTSFPFTWKALPQLH
jgi:hypothetical protein